MAVRHRVGTGAPLTNSPSDLMASTMRGNLFSSRERANISRQTDRERRQGRARTNSARGRGTSTLSLTNNYAGSPRGDTSGRMSWDRSGLSDRSGADMSWQRFQSRGNQVQFRPPPDHSEYFNRMRNRGPERVIEARKPEGEGTFKRGAMQGARIRAKQRSVAAKTKEREKRKAKPIGQTAGQQQVRAPRSGTQ